MFFLFVEGGGFVVNIVASKIISQHMFFFTLFNFRHNNLWNNIEKKWMFWPVKIGIRCPNLTSVRHFAVLSFVYLLSLVPNTCIYQKQGKIKFEYSLFSRMWAHFVRINNNVFWLACRRLENGQIFGIVGDGCLLQKKRFYIRFSLLEYKSLIKPPNLMIEPI